MWKCSYSACPERKDSTVQKLFWAFGLAGACVGPGLPVRQTEFPGGKWCIKNRGHITTLTIDLFGNYFCNIQSRGKVGGRVLLQRGVPKAPGYRRCLASALPPDLHGQEHMNRLAFLFLVLFFFSPPPQTKGQLPLSSASIHSKREFCIPFSRKEVRDKTKVSHIQKLQPIFKSRRYEKQYNTPHTLSKVGHGRWKTAFRCF